MSKLPPRKPTAEVAARQYYDNTMLGDYKKCPRYYYLRHERGWKSDAISKPLVFGGAWHAAMSVVWSGYRKLKQDKLLAVAMEAFWSKWVEEGGPREMNMATLEDWGARTPLIAEGMLYEYLKQRAPILEKVTLLHTEQPFAVPIFPDDTSIWVIGRKDEKIILNGEGILIEHKTTSEYKIEGGFKNTFIEQFSPNSQVEGYLYSDQFEKRYPAKMVWVDAALVHKKVHDKFKFIPISKATAGLEAWVWEARDWISRIQSELTRLDDGAGKHSHLVAFPKNTESCVNKYGTCQFLNICRSVQNPAKTLSIPEGYIEDYWRPFDVLGLDKIMGGDNG